MASFSMVRHSRLRPTIAVGWQAMGIMASAKSGWVSAQTKMCIQPIEVPSISLTRSTPSPSTSSRRWASTMSA